MSTRRSARLSSALDMRATAATVATSSQTNLKKRGRKPSLTGQNGDTVHDAATAMLPPPVTPVKRRRVKNTAGTQPPLTPTPSAVKLMTSQASYSTGDIDDAVPRSGEQHTLRPAQPHQTNATLITPRGTKLTARPDSTRSGPAVTSEPSETTGTLLAAACAHLLKVDPKLRTVIEQNPCPVFSPSGLAEVIDPFRSLVSGIMAQQVSGAAASSIKNKFVGLFNEDKAEGEQHVWPTPEVVAKTEITRLRLAGLSQRKAEYVQGLAEKFATGQLTAKMLVEGSDEEVFESLVAVRGLGAWSVEMFMCFALKRMDIFSTGDLGIQRGMAAHLGRDVSKLRNKGGKWKYLAEKDMIDMAAPFAPYRSLFMWYMWRIEDVDVSAVQDG